MKDLRSSQRPKRSSRVINRLLKTALKAWLRSQLTSIADLKIEVEGCDLNLLAGTIPKVCLMAEKAVYQGIHFSKIDIVAHQIQVNLKQILRGKPLQLMQPIPIEFSVLLQATDLYQSRTAPLMQSAVRDLLQVLLRTSQEDAITDDALSLPAIKIQEIQFKNNGFILKVQVPSVIDSSTATLETCLTIGHPQELLFYDLTYQTESKHNHLEQPQTTSINLGTQVNLKSLLLTPASLICKGQIEVQP
ncbi:LmeA family phospholipid-binding protein [Acaryochloris thomasi]|uniref:LmeA family phospholipid-binding protein n=1 Tax=Acaryochloris thomasi TaxID=2929456 RepID=UPI0013149959|nr:DUF2993 domain-containing protein [Acaryochloris thomasi]